MATHLTALSGTNPLGFLAALGVLVVFEDQAEQPCLWWTNDVIPHAVISGDFGVADIVRRAREVIPRWLDSPALSPRTGNKKTRNDAKFNPTDLRTYLEDGEGCHPGNRLASCLVAEGSHDNKGNAKPSDLYLSAGRVAFLRDARKILHEVSDEELTNGLLGPWRYDSSLPSLRWDIRDDPNWALAATKPGVKKRTCPGPEALALFGFSMVPVFGKSKRTLTQGCQGSWNEGGTFSWPIWRTPIGARAVKTILAHVTVNQPYVTTRMDWYRGWGVSQIMESTIRRSKTASGLGNMSPPRTTAVGG